MTARGHREKRPDEEQQRPGVLGRSTRVQGWGAGLGWRTKVQYARTLRRHREKRPDQEQQRPSVELLGVLTQRLCRDARQDQPRSCSQSARPSTTP